MSNASVPESGMNATPLIDVLLVLLVMIVITLPMGTHKVPLNLPQAVDRGTVHYPKVIVAGPKVEFHPDRRGPNERVALAMAAAQRARVASGGLRQQSC